MLLPEPIVTCPTCGSLSDRQLINSAALRGALNHKLFESQEALIKAISCVREIIVQESQTALDDPRWQECVRLIDVATTKAVTTP